MPFGLKKEPSIFLQKMNIIFNQYKQFVLVYIDNILVFSKDLREHLEHLQIVFNKFIKHGIIINRKKNRIM